MEKKIEEMAIDLHKVSEKVQDRCDEIDCRECGLDPFGKIECKYLARAKMLLEKGYRKTIMCCECNYCELVIDSIIDEPKWFCTRMVGSIPVDATDYCSQAKMKGK